MPIKTEPNLLYELLRRGRLRTIEAGEIVQSTEGNGVNLLAKGFVKRYLITTDGSLGTQIVYGPGSIFPITIVFKTLFNQSIYDGPEVFYYEAMSQIQVYTIDSTVFIEAVQSEPMLYRELLSEAGRRLHSTIHGLENLALKSSYKRLAHQLAYFGRNFGEQKLNKAILIKLPLTQQNLADMLSLTRETISVNFSQLRKAGLVQGSKSIVIPDIEKLEKTAYDL